MRKQLIIMSLTILLVSAFSYSIPAQSRPARTEGCSLINQSEFPLFVSYERYGQGESKDKGDGRQPVWLRLHNNTGCAIIIPTGSTKLTRFPDGRITTDLQDGAEVFINYEIEDVGRSRISKRTHGPGTLSLLPAGRSVIFSVPGHYFRKQLLVTVPFTYEWEGARAPGVGPVIHRVKFDSGELPDGLRFK